MTSLLLINSPMQEYNKNNRPRYETTAPLGLGYLATIASNAGIETHLIDSEAEKLSIDEIIERASSIQPDVVGINAFSTNYQIALKILKKIDTGYRMVGGPFATLYDGPTNNNLTIVRGEAESAILDLVNNRPKGIIDTKPVRNLDSLPFINRAFFKNDPYNINGKREASLITSRGCLFRCCYCAINRLNNNTLRLRSIENVIDEIQQLRAQGVNSIHFVDDLFNHTKDRVRNFCNSLKEKDINIHWRALCRVDTLDPTLIQTMRDSGCYKLAFGIESASPHILNYIGKSDDLKKVEETFKLCRNLGIKTKAFFTIGYPNETHDDIKKTIDFAKHLVPDEARFMVIRAFPGTRLYEDMRFKGFTHEELTEYKQFTGNGVYVKYHVMNIQSLNGMPHEKLDEYIKEAYKLISDNKK